MLDDDSVTALTAERAGWFSGVVPNAAAGARYRYRLPDGRLLPDPASRCQPDGPHGEAWSVAELLRCWVMTAPE